MVIDEPESYLERLKKRGGVWGLLLALALLLGALFLRHSPSVPLWLEEMRDNPSVVQRDEDFPALTGRVVDQASLIPANVEDQLYASLAALEAETGNQVVVVTLSSLDERAIRDVTQNLIDVWGSAQALKNRGVLLVVAPNERKVQIQAAIGLETVLTADICAQIIAQDISPDFEADKMVDGIVAGVNAIDIALRANQRGSTKTQLKGRPK